MGTYEDLKAAIQQVIRTNENNEITGALLQQTLLSIVNSVGANAAFAGIATPNTNPGTADQNVFYIATEAGTYANFGGIEIAGGEAVILSNKTENWTKITSGFATQQQLTELESDCAFISEGCYAAILAKRIGATLESYPNERGYFYMNQKHIRGRNIKGITLNVAKAGTITIVVAKGVNEPSYLVVNEFQLIANYIGLQYLQFPNSVVLEEDEWLGFSKGTDTLNFVYNENRDNPNQYYYWRNNSWVTDSGYDLGISVICELKEYTDLVELQRRRIIKYDFYGKTEPQIRVSFSDKKIYWKTCDLVLYEDIVSENFLSEGNTDIVAPNNNLSYSFYVIFDKKEKKIYCVEYSLINEGQYLNADRVVLGVGSLADTQQFKNGGLIDINGIVLLPNIQRKFVYDDLGVINFNGQSVSGIYKSPFYLVESFQERMRNKVIYGVRLNAATIGSFSVVKARNVSNDNYEEISTIVLYIPKIGLQEVYFDEPILLGEDEWLGVIAQNDTATFYYKPSSDQRKRGFAFWYKENYEPYPWILYQGDLDVDFLFNQQTYQERFQSIEQRLVTGLEDKSLSILGDSISTFKGYLASDAEGYDGTPYAYWYPSGNVTNVNQTWWKMLAEETGMKILKNCSWSDSECQGNSQSTSSALAGCSDRRISDLANGDIEPDVIICYIGVNDWGHGKALGTFDVNAEIPNEGTITEFAKAYTLMLDKIMRTYKHTRVFCCTLLNTGYNSYDSGNPGIYPPLNRNGVALYDFNEMIKKICNALGAEIIDITKCGFNFHNFTEYTNDKLHPNAAGMKMLKDSIKKQLINKFTQM